MQGQLFRGAWGRRTGLLKGSPGRRDPSSAPQHGVSTRRRVLTLTQPAGREQEVLRLTQQLLEPNGELWVQEETVSRVTEEDTHLHTTCTEV